MSDVLKPRIIYAVLDADWDEDEEPFTERAMFFDKLDDCDPGDGEVIVSFEMTAVLKAVTSVKLVNLELPEKSKKKGK